MPGAIFTTLEDGTRVNANIYEDKRDVYLDGGPGPNAPKDAAGLPDGNYYFQVTDPPGKKLLSQDPVFCREFRVEDGIIVEYVSIGREYYGKNPNKLIPCYVDGWEYGKHDLGLDIDHGALTIQLMPYKNTPNRGGVYKVWATPVEHFDGDPNLVDNGYWPGYYHGFVPAYSKTDNFKVRGNGKPKPTPEIEVCKFEDQNGNGIWETGEPMIPGWMIDVTDPLAVTNTYYTGENGCIVLDASMDGDYMIQENVPADWTLTTTIVDGAVVPTTDTVIVTVDYKAQLSYSVTFGNFQHFKVSGYKYNDMNGDGDWDVGEPGIEGWEITLERSTDGGLTWTTYATTMTDANGYYEFTVTDGGEYKVAEEDREGWTHTSDASFTFTAMSGVDQGPFDFFNFQCFSVSGYKYEDMNGDGDWDEGDTGLAGWTITLYKLDESGAWVEYTTTTTDSNGYYEFSVCEGGEYKVAETEMEGWIATGPAEYAFTAVSGQSQTFDFFNFELGEVCGLKWYDVDKDGVKDGTEDIITGFKVELWKDGILEETVFTDTNGEYCFSNLGPGSYEVKEIMPNAPGEYYVWANTYPGDGYWAFDMTSGFFKDDADFGNVVEYTGGLTWGYWKTHTGHGSPPRDPTYDLLPDNPMAVDVETPDGDYEVDNDDEAKWLFDGAGDYPNNCEGTCRSLFRAQLLALHMNLLKFGADMADAVYVYDGDDYDGWTVQEIYDEAIWKLLNEDEDYDFTSFQETLDNINNNGNQGTGDHVLVLPEAPPIEYP
ncbi:MAG: hypothetical protein KAW84_07445 [Thermoplasmata archaeon]|nr:hypothetical protein [Thermoplasmata archaeon]